LVFEEAFKILKETEPIFWVPEIGGLAIPLLIPVPAEVVILPEEILTGLSWSGKRLVKVKVGVPRTAES